MEEKPTPPAPELGDAQAVVDALVLPPVTSEILDAANSIRERYVDDPRFSDVEISRDRSTLTVWWHGETTAELDKLIAAAEIPVVVERTALSPGRLREAVREAVADASLGITAAAPKLDGSGIEVTLDTGGDERTGTQLRVSAEKELGVPVTVRAESSFTPARRQNDFWGLGGARINLWNGSTITGQCTTGFAIQNGTNIGVLTAAHCGLVGSQWVRWPDNAGPTVFAYTGNGVISSISAAHDAAILATNHHMGAVYTHAWNDSAGNAVAIKGTQEAFPGAELCYSGSFSGIVCGNVVDSTGWSYDLDVAGGPTSITITTGALTEHALGTASAGQGDSGGPGIMAVMQGGVPVVVASTLISAIAQPFKPCTGLGGRLCSDVVLSTSVPGALTYTGWSIKTG
ncbi:S1 family peptidase [Microbacterium sp. NIBRBAC000506063]|uniref:S1 family peptidase n=1 Tax=Microbacterium sp. NIBRBAC000506063 TaxID=2734618 RepID=UPI001BB7DEF7|nr:S1 family peptidase [Microbacterium sp. NIBRBAC000506063]QTV80351.1 hypothetical protein KAE78_05215 [Microbacterium sp. NIBRBAC000506063]